ncbi:hypothetical protein Misp02_10100 [Microtetraspora sp. NBRC 16547]|nr:hypothetical protein Misp02_10100 [Microtetraspora sp. NBRC 16547]
MVAAGGLDVDESRPGVDRSAGLTSASTNRAETVREKDIFRFCGSVLLPECEVDPMCQRGDITSIGRTVAGAGRRHAESSFESGVRDLVTSRVGTSHLEMMEVKKWERSWS